MKLSTKQIENITTKFAKGEAIKSIMELRKYTGLPLRSARTVIEQFKPTACSGAERTVYKARSIDLQKYLETHDFCTNYDMNWVETTKAIRLMIKTYGPKAVMKIVVDEMDDHPNA